MRVYHACPPAPSPEADEFTVAQRDRFGDCDIELRRYPAGASFDVAIVHEDGRTYTWTRDRMLDAEALMEHLSGGTGTSRATPPSGRPGPTAGAGRRPNPSI